MTVDLESDLRIDAARLWCSAGCNVLLHAMLARAGLQA